MHKFELPNKDMAIAHGLAAMSTVVSRSRSLERLVMDAPTAAHRSVRWHVVSGVVDDERRESWPTFPGDSRSGRVARNYKSVGLLGIGREALDEAGQYDDSVQAVAYALGKATMVAALPEGLQFGVDDKYPDTYLMGMGIGQGPLTAVQGLWYPDDKIFEVPHGSQPRAIRTYDVADFPADIPKF